MLLIKAKTDDVQKKQKNKYSNTTKNPFLRPTVYQLT